MRIADISDSTSYISKFNVAESDLCIRAHRRLKQWLQAAYRRALRAVAALHTHVSTEASQVVVLYCHLSE